MQWVKIQKHGLVSRKEKNSRSVVFCIPKGYGAAEVALRGRLATLRLAQSVEHLSIKQSVIGSTPITNIIGILYRKRKVRFGIM